MGDRAEWVQIIAYGLLLSGVPHHVQQDFEVPKKWYAQTSSSTCVVANPNASQVFWCWSQELSAIAAHARRNAAIDDTPCGMEQPLLLKMRSAASDIAAGMRV